MVDNVVDVNNVLLSGVFCSPAVLWNGLELRRKNRLRRARAATAAAVAFIFYLLLSTVVMLKVMFLKFISCN